MCCGAGNTTKPSEVISKIQKSKKIPASPPLPEEKFKIDPQVKADLIRQQQLMRLKKP